MLTFGRFWVCLLEAVIIANTFSFILKCIVHRRWGWVSGNRCLSHRIFSCASRSPPIQGTWTVDVWYLKHGFTVANFLLNRDVIQNVHQSCTVNHWIMKYLMARAVHPLNHRSLFYTQLKLTASYNLHWNLLVRA